MKRKVCSNLADLLPAVASSDQEWRYEIDTVRAHIGRSTGRSIPPVQASSSQELQFHISAVRAHIGRSPGRSNPPPVEVPTMALLDFYC